MLCPRYLIFMWTPGSWYGSGELNEWNLQNPFLQPFEILHRNKLWKSHVLQENVLSFICDAYQEQNGNLKVPESLCMKKDITNHREVMRLKTYRTKNRYAFRKYHCSFFILSEDANLVLGMFKAFCRSWRLHWYSALGEDPRSNHKDQWNESLDEFSYAR